MSSTREPRHEVIVRGVREAILDGELRPGTRLPQEWLAQQYGASRIPVREALRQLADEGLVTLERDVGARVTVFDPSELVQVYFMRERLEPLVLAESIPHLTDDDIETLREHVAASESFAQNGDLASYIAVDRQFHFDSYRAAPYALLRAQVETFWNTTQHYRRVYGLLPRSVELSVAEHRLILEAIQRRAAPDAAQLLEVHIRRTRLALGKVFGHEP